MFAKMKKIYQNPTTLIVKLNGGAVCDALVVGSGLTSSTRGDGTDLVKEDNVSSSSRYNVWDDDWSD